MAKPLRVLMFGWEWPPFNSGGLGVACYGLSYALSRRGLQLAFVLPRHIRATAHFLKLYFIGGHEPARKLVNAYASPKSASLARLLQSREDFSFLQDLFTKERFDVIHAHDWMSFDRALFAKELSGKPLVAHIHSTIFDRTGGHNINQEIYEIEKRGMQAADAVITVSQFTKNTIIAHYGIAPENIHVVHNGFDLADYQPISAADMKEMKGRNSFVLFVGRITLQKGPDYFVRVAKRIAEMAPRVRFILAGAGDMERKILQETAWLGLTDRFYFTGFLRGEELRKIYTMADVYVMPSVSEPFGITALEALAHHVPVVMSKQSGAAEVVRHALKADFWDIDELANKILAILSYPALKKCLCEYGRHEVEGYTWDKSAAQCDTIYKSLTA